MPVVIDFETKHTFREFSDPAKLQISVAGIYDYASDKGYVFQEHELQGLFNLIEQASCVIGFNIDEFDLPVLEPYYAGDTKQFYTFDIMQDVREKLGRRLSLDSIIKATLKKQKTGHGLRAVELFKEKKIEELSQYCLDDVMLTKELFEYGVENGEISYLSPVGTTNLAVSWKHYRDGRRKGKDMNLTLPF
ncbi:MAG: ribonuclease H-like domain-containing protein [Candidatus Roizmanbacteria bacterium]